MTVKITGSDGVLAAIPTIVGFHPQDSLVMIGLQGRSFQVGPVARVDLADVAETTPGLVRAAERHADAGVIVVTYGNPDGNRTPSVRAFLDALANSGILVRDTIHTDNLPVPATPDLAASAALSGRATLPNRDTVRASINGPVTDRHMPDEVRALLTRLSDPTARDAYLVNALTDDDDGAHLAELFTAAKHTPDDMAADLCAVLATVAYCAGDGALANVAIDRALASDPEHRLAHLMVQTIMAGITPEQLKATLT